jgi:hypothetical protein
MCERINRDRRRLLSAAVMTSGVIGAAVALYSFTAMAQTARDILGPAAVVPLTSEPAPKIVIDPPLAEPLAHGRVVIQYRAENLRIVPVFGPNSPWLKSAFDAIQVWVQNV